MRKVSSPSTLRCAIYTRKSTAEGLEQDFNSLDAQREACAAYVLSQRHEGWTLVPDLYDDGGYSGGTMERPALKALLAEVAAGRVDIIVVYKVDRLTRSLNDFAKIVEILDVRSASFVSVTQSFNTTTSMGRLTLNVLLSFAQFEREVTGERIRDKIAASKAKGMWMGGPIPLGYRLEDRKLLIEPGEAELIRHMFARYLELGSGRLLVAELDRDGIRSKARINRHGRAYGRQPISRGALYAILQNRLYIGEVVHKGQVYPGLHDAIIDHALFDVVQARMAEGRNARLYAARAEHPSLLAGLLWDDHGRKMTPSHALKAQRRYRYYVSQTDGDAASAEPAWRLPANEIERLVVAEAISAIHLRAEAIIAAGNLGGSDIQWLHEQVSMMAARLEDASPSAMRAALLDMIQRIDIATDAIEIRLNLATVSELLDQEQPIIIARSIHLRRSAQHVKIVIPAAANDEPDRNPALLKLVAQAFRARSEMEAGGSFDAVAARLGCGRENLADMIRTSYLAPGIIEAIVEGRQPTSMTRMQLVRANRVPLDWREQRQMFGCG